MLHGVVLRHDRRWPVQECLEDLRLGDEGVRRDLRVERLEIFWWGVL